MFTERDQRLSVRLNTPVELDLACNHVVGLFDVTGSLAPGRVPEEFPAVERPRVHGSTLLHLLCSQSESSRLHPRRAVRIERSIRSVFVSHQTERNDHQRRYLARRFIFTLCWSNS